MLSSFLRNAHLCDINTVSYSNFQTNLFYLFYIFFFIITKFYIGNMLLLEIFHKHNWHFPISQIYYSPSHIISKQTDTVILNIWKMLSKGKICNKKCGVAFQYMRK